MNLVNGSLVTFRYNRFNLYSRLPRVKDDPSSAVLGIIVDKNYDEDNRAQFFVMWSDEPGRRLSYFEEELVQC